MPSCDLLLANALVVTMDRDYRVYSDSAVAVAGDRLAAEGPAARDYDATEQYEGEGRVGNWLTSPARQASMKP